MILWSRYHLGFKSLLRKFRNFGKCFLNCLNSRTFEKTSFSKLHPIRSSQYLQILVNAVLLLDAALWLIAIPSSLETPRIRTKQKNCSVWQRSQLVLFCRCKIRVTVNMVFFLYPRTYLKDWESRKE